MRVFLLYILPWCFMIDLAACSNDKANPWLGLNYAEAECGTKEAILTTTGCITTPPVQTSAANGKLISTADDVSNNHSSNANTNSQNSNGANR